MAELKVTEDCIGCESCVEICPAVFEMNDTTGHATVKDPSSTAPCADEAIDICPVQAIVRE
ncbi:MAG: ferredoxin [Deltaproteobacteria bacterium]|nr:ferredoxin [Deltaproteobacteria bacterium]